MKKLSRAEQKAMEIWKTQEVISQIMRTCMRSEVKESSGEILAEKLPGRHNDTLVAVRHLCEQSPEGVPLNKLAKYMRIAPPMASVIVEAMVSQGYIERSTSPDDRRAKRIRLTPRAEEIYMSGDKAILKIIAKVAGGNPPGFLDEWHGTLLKVKNILERVNGKSGAELE